MARIIFAARFTSTDLDITLMLVERGPESALRIRVDLQSPYGTDLWLWTHGGWDSEASTYVSAGWQGTTDPWDACNYWGPLKASGTDGGKFCGSCGEARVPGGKFCGNCGVAFTDSPLSINTLRNHILDAVEDSKQAPSVIAQLIETHSLSELEPELRSSVVHKIRESLFDLNSSSFIDGVTPNNSHKLTLADAQRVAQQVVHGDPLGEADRQVAIELLTRAPLFFGWWGPFKALLKFLDPAETPEQFGVAIARIEASFPRPATSVEGCENIDLLDRMFTVPSANTANYMRRRVRRDLAKLADNQPNVYAKVAIGLLRAWDSAITYTSFAPAYILLGGTEYLDSGSRHVKLPVAQVTRRDAHPEIWDRFPEMALELIPHIKKSTEIYTFARQVLRDASIDAPALNDVTVPLALMSTDGDIQRSGQAALSAVPGCWPQLSDSVWESFLETADETDLHETVAGLLRHKRIHNVAYAAYQILATSEEQFSASRWEAIAKVYLAYSAATSDGYRDWPHSLQADVTAVAALATAHDFSLTPDMWRSVLGSISVEAIIVALHQLTGRGDTPAGSQSLLAELAVKKDSDWQLETRIKGCLGYGNELMREIAWRTADLLEDQSRVLSHVSEWLRQSDLDSENRTIILHEILRRVSGDDASALLTSVLTDASWGFNDQQIADMLSSSTEAALLLWNALGAEDPSVVLNLVEANSSILTLIGRSLSVANTKTMSAAQISVVSDYLRAHPDRISHDPEFGVHLACLPQPSVQAIAVDQLSSAGHLQQFWLTLAESALPIPLNAAFEQVTSIRDAELFTDSVLVCIDSPVPQVRDFGLRLLDTHHDRLNLSLVWDSLVHTDDPVVQARVIEESLVRRWDNDEQLSALDQRLLVTRRGNRRTKENIKTRIQSSNSELVSPQRMAALQDMASGRNTHDREWALQRLAHLSLAGIDLDNIEVSLTSGGQN